MDWRAQRGSSTPLFLAAWAAALLFLAFAVDFGRFFLVREQLRTAEDAAALAGALQMEYRIRLEWRRVSVRWETVCEASSGTERECRTVEQRSPMPPLVIAGPEAEVWPGLRRRLAEVCASPAVECQDLISQKCWLAPRGSMEQVRSRAREAFMQNQWWGHQARLDGPVEVMLPNEGVAEPQEFPVEVRARLRMKTLLLAAVGIPELTVEKAGPPTRASPVRRDGGPRAPSVGPLVEAEIPSQSPCDALAVR